MTFRVRRCCHSNETRAPIANPPNIVQLEGTPYQAPKLKLGLYLIYCFAGLASCYYNVPSAMFQSVIVLSCVV